LEKKIDIYISREIQPDDDDDDEDDSDDALLLLLARRWNDDSFGEKNFDEKVDYGNTGGREEHHRC